MACMFEAVRRLEREDGQRIHADRLLVMLMFSKLSVFLTCLQCRNTLATGDLFPPNRDVEGP